MNLPVARLAESLSTRYTVKGTWSHLPYTEGVEITLPNGWGVSIARGSGTYGGASGLFEAMAVDPSGALHGEPAGWLEPWDVGAFVAEVATR